MLLYYNNMYIHGSQLCNVRCVTTLYPKAPQIANLMDYMPRKIPAVIDNMGGQLKFQSV